MQAFAQPPSISGWAGVRRLSSADGEVVVSNPTGTYGFRSSEVERYAVRHTLVQPVVLIRAEA